MRWASLLIVLGVGVAGCNGINMQAIKQPMTVNFIGEAPPQPVAAVYCYNNLAHSPDCYDVPIEPEVRRLMGYYGPPPVNRGYYGRRAF
ncbi:MAG: hypothetical protein HY060_14360 [Proteobacteria bacterium]|nr:hypothetical protein [Pseudomonadota bacterium]